MELDPLAEYVLEDHLLLLGEVEQLIQEENSLLKQTGQPPDHGFIRKKSRLVPRLEVSLGLLRKSAVGQEASAAARGFLQDAQRKLHKLLLLDRENEALLLRSALHRGGPAPTPAKVGADRLARVYSAA